MSDRIYAADLFCGAGGFSTGLLSAEKELGVEVELVAIDHWSIAIETYSRNHPAVRHLCQNVESVNPRDHFPGGKLHLLMASPECTHHSNARGGRPMSDQSRATAWHILRWLEALDVENVLIENVPEFRTWGPLYPDDYRIEAQRGRPIEKRKGAYFRNFLRNLKVLGYRVDYQVLNSANYGDATSRHRLFLLARKGRRPITWPEPTHTRRVDAQQTMLVPDLPRWRTAREVIDWSLRGGSIYERERPLATNTMRRILTGVQRFSGLPFLVPQFGEREGQEPRTHSIDEPLPAVTSHGAGALIEPEIVEIRPGERIPFLTAPLEPFLVVLRNNGTARQCFGIAEPLLRGVAEIFEPSLVEYHGGRDADQRVQSVDEPVPTIDCANRFAIAEPFLIRYNRTGEAISVDEPMPTITTRDRLALVHPELVRTRQVNGHIIGWLDIRFRMLQDHELSAAMSFPRDYQFAGTREDRVKQIGNAVPVRTAKELCRTALGETATTSVTTSAQEG